MSTCSPTRQKGCTPSLALPAKASAWAGWSAHGYNPQAERGTTVLLDRVELIVGSNTEWLSRVYAARTPCSSSFSFSFSAFENENEKTESLQGHVAYLIHK